MGRPPSIHNQVEWSSFDYELTRSPLPCLPSPLLQREFIYSLIRKLDDGSIDGKEFIFRLEQNKVKVSPNVRRLVHKHRSDGIATFNNMVRAFQDYFEELQKSLGAGVNPEFAFPEDKDYFHEELIKCS